MAKKKEQELGYLQLPLPEATDIKRLKRISWAGLNKRQTIDTGALSMEKNISTNELPYIVPSMRRMPKSGDNRCGNPSKDVVPLYMFGYGQVLIVIYWESDTKGASNGDIKIDYIADIADNQILKTATLKTDITKTKLKDEPQRSLVKFNVYDNINDPIAGDFVEKILIFPDKYSMNASADVVLTDGLDLAYMEPDGQTPIAIPNISYATIHLSRVFGVGQGKIYASHFNDYTDWTLDTADEYNESNAWVSETQANSKAEGNFTGITAFNNHVICFKQDFMHEIYNNKNPFRVQDIFAEGCIDNRSIADVDGNLFFVSKDGVKLYTGANPKVVGYDIGIDVFDKAVAGTDNRRYYLYCESRGKKHLFVYDTFVGQWSEEFIDKEVVCFSNNQNGIFALLDDGFIYRIDTNRYDHQWAFETDFISSQTIDIKHLKRVQLFADIKSGSWVKVYLLKNGEQFTEGISQLLYNSGGKSGIMPIRMLVRQSAAYGFKLRFEGYGYVKLYEMELDVAEGGYLYV